MRRVELAVVGAGAAGLLAACRAAAVLGGHRIALLEGNPRPGKKLLVTGNGRCNLTNLHISPGCYHGDTDLAAPLLEACPARRVLEAFEELGLLCRADGEGRVYPLGNQAAAVLRTLWGACREAGVEILGDFPVTEVLREQGGFVLRSSQGQALFARQLLLACGGRAAPGQSCAASGYRLAEGLGHSVTALQPSLVPLKSPSRLCRSLKGQRCRARVTLWRDGREIAGESGEVIFGDGQLSGICVFNLSARLEGGPGWELRLDLLEQAAPGQVLDYLRRLQANRPRLPAGSLLDGAVNLRVGQELVKSLGIPEDRLISTLDDRLLEQVATAAKGWRFPVSGPGNWSSAQVTKGGVPLAELDMRTMASQKCPGLFLAGELLNIDGDCGGYNLHWAWATALRFAEGLREAGAST